ncbi:uncharacterized protein M437DRAFT_53308, partial [Aureobasidium melanogenum CBS 110374]
TRTMSVFNTNCSLPDPGSNFVESPNVRGTLDILWSCLSVLLLCTWSIQHLKIPHQCRPRSIRQQTNKFVVQLGSKVRWMLVTLIAPELLCGVAAEEWLTACKTARFIAERAKDDGIDWTSSHGFFAQMEGFRLRFRNLESQESQEHQRTSIVAKEPSLEKHSIAAPSQEPLLDVQNGALIERMICQHQNDPRAGDVALTAIRMTTDIWTLSLEQIQLARKYGIIETFPDMGKEDLDAISNSDGLAKALAVCQVLWLIIQMISRAASSLAVCQLEVATGAFAITTFLTYMFLWQKPQGVSRPIYLEAVRRPTVAEAWELAQCGLEETSSLLYRARSWRQSREHLKARAFSNTIMLICATALGAVHCAAWNFEFPSRVEMWAWRGCALGSTIIPLFLLLWHELYLRFAFTKHMVFSIVILVGFMLYGFTRLFIMVEMIRCLFFLPVEAFVTTWTINLPGIS